MNGGTGGALSDVEKRWLFRCVVVIVALTVALVSWLVTRDSGSEEAAPEAAPASHAVVPAELKRQEAVLGQQIFWAGHIPGTHLELRQLGGGKGVQVMYAPQAGGSGGQEGVLTVGTYPVSNAARGLRTLAIAPDAIVRHSRDGRTLVTSGNRPTSVYFFDAKSSVQVEVYDPSPRRAMRLALSGKVVPAP